MLIDTHEFEIMLRKQEHSTIVDMIINQEGIEEITGVIFFADDLLAAFKKKEEEDKKAIEELMAKYDSTKHDAKAVDV